jgi:superfamily I DNA/RNA helicase
MYLEEHRSIFHRKGEKIYEYKLKVYNILKAYKNWCNNNSAFDLMDVVNHNLRSIELYGSCEPKINYMFVDEVQDLTSATIFLISKMVIKNIFYCGDTAQAITKGVSFRF